MGGRHRHTTKRQLCAAIRGGEVDRVASILAANPQLIGETYQDRTWLHHATDWPGNWDNVADTIAILVAHGADVDAPFPHPDNPAVAEKPLHWAASCGDVAAVDALLDAGAAIDPLGGIFGGCTPFEEAVIFEHYAAARRLHQRGAQSYLPGEAALGHFDSVRSYFDDGGNLRLDIGMLPHWREPPPVQVLLDRAFQFACRAGYLDIAKFLAERGADVRSVTPANTSSLDEARKNGHTHVVAWLDNA